MGWPRHTSTAGKALAASQIRTLTQRELVAVASALAGPATSLLLLLGTDAAA